MKVSELIEQLQKCPQDMKVTLLTNLSYGWECVDVEIMAGEQIYPKIVKVGNKVHRERMVALCPHAKDVPQFEYSTHPVPMEGVCVKPVQSSFTGLERGEVCYCSSCVEKMLSKIDT